MQLHAPAGSAGCAKQMYRNAATSLLCLHSSAHSVPSGSEHQRLPNRGAGATRAAPGVAPRCCCRCCGRAPMLDACVQLRGGALVPGGSSAPRQGQRLPARRAATAAAAPTTPPALGPCWTAGAARWTQCGRLQSPENLNTGCLLLAERPPLNTLRSRHALNGARHMQLPGVVCKAPHRPLRHAAKGHVYTVAGERASLLPGVMSMAPATAPQTHGAAQQQPHQQPACERPSTGEAGSLIHLNHARRVG
jgi:hypothetical protein